MKVWQCTKTTYHTMVRQVTRCTLCGSRVEERVLKEKENDERSKNIESLMSYEPF